MSCCCASIMKCFKHNNRRYVLQHISGEGTFNSSSQSTNITDTNKSNGAIQKYVPDKNETIPVETPVDNERDTAKEETVTRPVTPVSVASQLDVQSNELKMERRAGVPLQPQNIEKKLDDVEIITTTKDKKTEEILQKAIMANEFLRYILDAERLQKCIDAMYPKTLNSGEYIIKEGDTGLHLYVSVEGSFEITKGGMIVKRFKHEETFGELAILYNTKRFASVQAVTMAKVFVLDRRVYQKIMLRSAIEEQEANTNFMKNIPIFQGVHDSVLEKVVNLLKKEFYETGSVIVRQGDRGDKFFIIKAGTVLITKRTSESGIDESVGKIGKGAFFGELALLKEDSRQATVTAQAPGVEVLTLDRNNFIQHFGDLEALKNIEFVKPEVQEPVTQKKTEFSHIQLDDLDVLATLGVGGFGRVELVQHRHNKKNTFALKYLKKLDMVLQQQQEHAFNEKLIMMTCDSDFICKLYNTYRDAKYLYFLMEVCLGGDVWTVIQKQKSRCFDEKTSRFMAACVIEAFDYLHKRQIVYRDLKPENLLLDAQGYIKLVDFGFAKLLGSSGKTFTFAGTPEYVAPEIILNRGHDKAVDYWALGIFIHELIIGKPPFRGSDHMKTYNMIIRGIDAIELPEKMSKNAKLLIRKLCRAVPSDRLGCQKNGMDDVRTNKWFCPSKGSGSFDWDLLRSRKMVAPLKPKIRNEADMSNFDKYPKDTDIPPDETSGWDKDF